MNKRIHTSTLVVISGQMPEAIIEQSYAVVRRLRELDRTCPGCDQCSPGPVQDVSDKMKELSAIQRLAACARATILFYEPWTDEVRLEWDQLTRCAPASTKGLANFCREALSATDFPLWADKG